MLCIQNGTIMHLSLHITASDISQGQNWCCVFETVQYRPMSLHIAASDMSQGQNWCFISKSVISPCVFAYCYIRYITSDKTGVVYSKRCNIALCLCILLHLLYHIAGIVYSKWCSIMMMPIIIIIIIMK